MAGQAEFSAAVILGFGPPVLLMFWGLRKYDYPYVEKALFSDRKLFASFAVGMVTGTLLGFLFSVLLASPFEPFSFLVLLLILAAVEEAGKMAYLNLPNLRGKFDAIFYGISLALGISATMAMAWAYTTITSSPDVAWTPTTLGALVLFSVSLACLEYTTGSVLGLGAARRRAFGPLATAMGIRAAYALPFALLLAVRQPIHIATGMAILLAIAAGFAWWTSTRLVPEGLPEDVRRQIRRQRRRTAPD